MSINIDEQMSVSETPGISEVTQLQSKEIQVTVWSAGSVAEVEVGCFL